MEKTISTLLFENKDKDEDYLFDETIQKSIETDLESSLRQKYSEILDTNIANTLKIDINTSENILNSDNSPQLIDIKILFYINTMKLELFGQISPLIHRG